MVTKLFSDINFIFEKKKKKKARLFQLFKFFIYKFTPKFFHYKFLTFVIITKVGIFLHFLID